MRKHILAAAVAIALALTLVVLAHREVRSQITAIAPLASQSLSLPTSVTQVVAPNPTRRALIICNVGVTNTAWLAPIAPPGQTGVTVAANGAGSFQLSVMPAAGNGVVPSCLQVTESIPPTGSPPQPLVTAGFNGIAVGGATNVTVWEF